MRLDIDRGLALRWLICMDMGWRGRGGKGGKRKYTGLTYTDEVEGRVLEHLLSLWNMMKCTMIGTLYASLHTESSSGAFFTLGCTVTSRGPIELQTSGYDRTRKRQ